MIMRHILAILAVILASGVVMGQNSSGKTIVLETLTIEGKIKKPQVALISAEKRPEIKPMALASLDSRKDITKNVRSDIFEYRYYNDPFNVEDAQFK
jgi:hypothetical protein